MNCIVKAINLLHTILIRRFCKDDNHYNSDQECFQSEFASLDGYLKWIILNTSYTLLSSLLAWEKDDKHIACGAVCDLYNDLLNVHREEFTCSALVPCLSSVLSYIPQLSILTTQSFSSLPQIELLVKAVLVTCSRSSLHELQIQFLQNGTFIYHLYKAIASTASEETFSHEFVMASVTDSDEGYRVLTRIFPTPITKKLDISTGSVKFKGISYKMPIVESTQDSELYDNMALVTVFNPLRANWHGFWKSLSLESNNYNCIWNNVSFLYNCFW